MKDKRRSKIRSLADIFTSRERRTSKDPLLKEDKELDLLNRKRMIVKIKSSSGNYNGDINEK